MAGWWILLIDTSRRTDLVLSLVATFLVAGLTLWAAILGAGPAAVGLGALTAILAGTSWYARLLWMREPVSTGLRRIK